MAGVACDGAGRCDAIRGLRSSAPLYGGLIAANIGAWIWAWAAFRERPALLGIALLAWVFGLRHAVDADHIAAIDNVVRKLMHDGKRPLTAGLWFSLGHSTIVILASLAIAATAAAIQGRFDAARQVGGIIGTVVSAAFLLVIAVANLAILRGVWCRFREVRRGGDLDDDALDLLLARRGMLARLFRPLFRAITESWHMYPLGFLFGLGFDTATEVGLLGIAATQAAQGYVALPASNGVPRSFHRGHGAGGHDGQRADGRRLWLGLHQSAAQAVGTTWTITAASKLIALLIGGIEALGLIGSQLALSGPFWDIVGTLNDRIGNLGFAVVGIFILCWAVSAIVYRVNRYDLVGSELP